MHNKHPYISQRPMSWTHNKHPIYTSPSLDRYWESISVVYSEENWPQCIALAYLLCDQNGSYPDNKFKSISDYSGYELRQWGTSLQCNVISYWLSSYPEWSLRSFVQDSMRIWEENTIFMVSNNQVCSAWNGQSATRPIRIDFGLS